MRRKRLSKLGFQLDTRGLPGYHFALSSSGQTATLGEYVPNTKSAIKRLRQSERRRTRNKAARSQLKTAVKKVRSASEPEQAAGLYREAARLLDRAASRGLIHKNQADRSKGRLAAHVRRVGGTP